MKLRHDFHVHVISIWTILVFKGLPWLQVTCFQLIILDSPTPKLFELVSGWPVWYFYKQDDVLIHHRESDRVYIFRRNQPTNDLFIVVFILSWDRRSVFKSTYSNTNSWLASEINTRNVQTKLLNTSLSVNFSYNHQKQFQPRKNKISSL